jgi:membrane-bound lytic murein transglycosylase F
MEKWFSFGFRTLFLTSFLFLINACDPLWTSSTAFGGVAVEGLPLKLLVVRQPLTYQKVSAFESGLEYEILQAFALDLGYKLEISIVPNQTELIRRLGLGKGDLGAARIAEFASARTGLIKSRSYDEEKTSLVCRKDSEVEFNRNGQMTSQAHWKLAVNAETIHPSWISSFSKNAPRLKISNYDGASSLQLLRLLNRKKADCTLLDRLEAHSYFRVFSNLEIVKDVSPAQTYHFLLSDSRPDLANQLQKWLSRASRRQLLTQFKLNFKNKTQALSDQDVRRFMRLRASALPEYSTLFRKHSRDFGIPWQLTAAVSYQESHWDPQAESFTGVKGLMQLTQETAEHVGVEDRLNPNQSVWGGVKYLRMLLDRQPKMLPFRERLALALATYNIGPAHMIDAQRLAAKLGKNPYLWKDLQTVLPLLADKNYFSELKYGPARGEEPVLYVHRVLAFLDLITIQI